jgi:hypothetical protein
MVGESIVKPSKTHRMKEPEEGFDVTILPSRETGLPFVVFILQDIGIIPEVRIEIARSQGDQFGEYEAASMHSPLLSIVVNGVLTGCRGLILAISIQIVPDRTSRYPIHAKGLIRFRKVLYRTLVVQHHLGHQVAASLQDAAMYDHVAIHETLETSCRRPATGLPVVRPATKASSRNKGINYVGGGKG